MVYTFFPRHLIRILGKSNNCIATLHSFTLSLSLCLCFNNISNNLNSSSLVLTYQILFFTFPIYFQISEICLSLCVCVCVFSSPLKFLTGKRHLTDPRQRITLQAIAGHPWVIGEEGPIPEFLCQCKRKNSLSENAP